jgi:chromate reductase
MLEAMSAPPLTLALFTGSLRPDGVSAAAAHSVKSVLPGHLQAVDVAFGGFPLYDPRLHLGPLGSPDGADLPEPVRSAYFVVREAAGVMIVTPEYNYGIPGGLKNALDWLSRPGFKSVFAGKRVAVLSVSPQRHRRRARAGGAEDSAGRHGGPGVPVPGGVRSPGRWLPAAR